MSTFGNVVKASTYVPNLVKVRDYINNYGSRYGLKNSSIGYRSDPDLKNGMVTLGGEDLIDPMLNDKGSTYADENMLRSAIDNYAKRNSILDTSGFKSPYEDETNSLLKEILNTPTYSFNKDTNPTWQAYKNEYTDNANNAYEDTAGELAGLTNGRQNSWSQTVAQEAKQNTMQQLDDKLPEVQDEDFNQYLNELNNKINQLGVLNTLGNSARSAYESDRNYNYNTNRANEADAESNRNFNYQVTRDKILDDRWLKQFNDDQKKELINEALQSRQISNSEANTVLSKDRFDWEKDPTNPDNQYKRTQIQNYIEEYSNNKNLNNSFKSMMSSGDPEKWLDSNKENMTPKAYSELKKMVPQKETLGPLYNSMMNEKNSETGLPDPEGWIRKNSPYLTDDELKALKSLINKGNLIDLINGYRTNDDK